MTARQPPQGHPAAGPASGEALEGFSRQAVQAGRMCRWACAPGLSAAAPPACRAAAPTQPSSACWGCNLALALSQALAQERVHAEGALDQGGRGAAGPRLDRQRQRARLAGRPADADARVGQPEAALDAQRQRQRARARAQLEREPRAAAARVLVRQAVVLDQRARGRALAGRREDPGDTAASVG